MSSDIRPKLSPVYDTPSFWDVLDDTIKQTAKDAATAVVSIMATPGGCACPSQSGPVSVGTGFSPEASMNESGQTVIGRQKIIRTDAGQNLTHFIYGRYADVLSGTPAQSGGDVIMEERSFVTQDLQDGETRISIDRNNEVEFCNRRLGRDGVLGLNCDRRTRNDGIHYSNLPGPKVIAKRIQPGFAIANLSYGFSAAWALEEGAAFVGVFDLGGDHGDFLRIGRASNLALSCAGDRVLEGGATLTIDQCIVAWEDDQGVHAVEFEQPPGDNIQPRLTSFQKINRAQAHTPGVFLNPKGPAVLAYIIDNERGRGTLVAEVFDKQGQGLASMSASRALSEDLPSDGFIKPQVLFADQGYIKIGALGRGGSFLYGFECDNFWIGQGCLGIIPGIGTPAKPGFFSNPLADEFNNRFADKFAILKYSLVGNNRGAAAVLETEKKAALPPRPNPQPTSPIVERDISIQNFGNFPTSPTVLPDDASLFILDLVDGFLNKDIRTSTDVPRLIEVSLQNRGEKELTIDGVTMEAHDLRLDHKDEVLNPQPSPFPLITSVNSETPLKLAQFSKGTLTFTFKPAVFKDYRIAIHLKTNDPNNLTTQFDMMLHGDKALDGGVAADAGQASDGSRVVEAGNGRSDAGDAARRNPDAADGGF